MTTFRCTADADGRRCRNKARGPWTPWPTCRRHVTLGGAYRASAWRRRGGPTVDVIAKVSTVPERPAALILTTAEGHTFTVTTTSDTAKHILFNIITATINNLKRKPR